MINNSRNTRVSCCTRSLCIHKLSRASVSSCIVVYYNNKRNASRTRRSRFVVIKYNKSSPLYVLRRSVFFTRPTWREWWRRQCYNISLLLLWNNARVLAACVSEMPPPPPRQFIRQRVIRIGAAPVSAAAAAAADAFEKRSRTTHKSATADATRPSYYNHFFPPTCIM